MYHTNNDDENNSNNKDKDRLRPRRCRTWRSSRAARGRRPPGAARPGSGASRGRSRPYYIAVLITCYYNKNNEQRIYNTDTDTDTDTNTSTNTNTNTNTHIHTSSNNDNIDNNDNNNNNKNKKKNTT